MNTVDLHCKAYSYITVCFYKEKYLKLNFFFFFLIDQNLEHFLKC